MLVISCPLIAWIVIPSRNPSWNTLEFWLTDITWSPFSRACGGREKIEIKDKRTTAISIHILNVIFILLFLYIPFNY